MVDEHAVALAAEIQRDILVGDLRIGPAVFVPHVDRLPVAHEWREPLAQAVDRLAGLQRQLLAQVGLPALLEQADGLALAAGQRLTAAQKVDPPFTLCGDAHCQIARLEPGMCVVAPDLRRGVGQRIVEIERGQARAAALEVGELDADHVRHGRSEPGGGERPMQQIIARLDLVAVPGDDQRVRLGLHVHDSQRIDRFRAR